LPEVLERLQSALVGRYTIERELGRGGMATVYLALDLKHHRPVALKVLHPQLAAVLGADRFLREIETAANLNHPHILPLFDSGRTEEFLFYAMPLVDGESLRDRLERERQLPLDDALQIAREVADALGYAHSCGIIHRDIKPANILLAHGHALVADFGIARAVGAAGGERLTETGLAIGTPAYMSPEQASGERETDGRADIYALGCVLYEMLAGQPPFTGPTARSILARHAIDPVPSLHTVRPLPPEVEGAVVKALAKVPADRFATAHQFVEALKTGPPSLAARERRSGSEGRRRWGWPLSTLVVVAVATAVGILRSRRSSSVALDPNLIAVFPFRLSGTDTSHAALREGMVDLLEVRFSGEGGPRVLPSRTAVAAWHRSTGAGGEDPTDEAAAGLARRLGAGSLVLGTLVATPYHLLISGTLFDAATGRIRAQAKVEGAPDSIMVLVDTLATQLVALGAGTKQYRVASLTTTSLPALYAYLAGRIKYRAGRFGAALVDFDRAIELDSTFALAALGYAQAGYWADPQSVWALALAWTHRDRLSSRDRLIFIALAGPGYPGESSPRDQVSALEAVVRRVPDDPDLWNYLGDRYFHDGALVGLAEPWQLAADAFNRALSLDTTLNVEPMIHLLQIAEVEGDTETVRGLLDRFPPDDGESPSRELLAAVVLKDTAMLARARRNLDSAGLGEMWSVIFDPQVFGFGIKEAERVVPIFLSRAKTRADSVGTFGAPYILYQNLGRPAAAAAVLAQLGPLESLIGTGDWWSPKHWYFSTLLGYALSGDGDTAIAARTAAILARSADAPLVADSAERQVQFDDICNLERWRLAHGNTLTARASIARLLPRKAKGCATLLRALLAFVERSPDTTATLDSLEEMMAAGHHDWWWNLDIARLREARGDVAGALRAVRRRPRYGGPPYFLSYALREEGRLAALAGDREGAIMAYSRYLVLRYNPEPSIKPAVDSVRAELGRLVGEQ
jgi:serine/threonine-protein kinase